MRNIETFPSKHMYPYISLVERKVAEFFLYIDRMRWLVWIKMTYFHHFFWTIHGVLGHEGCSRRVYFSLHPPLLSLAGKCSSSTILLIFISHTVPAQKSNISKKIIGVWSMSMWCKGTFQKRQCHVMSNCFVLPNSKWSETIFTGSLSSHFAHTSSHRLLPLPRPDHPGRQDHHHH